jgi:pimeloyl-ACP methyl ester carboxylesterase
VRVVLALLLMILVWLPGCRTEALLSGPASGAETVIIVIPGLYGSRLVQDLSPASQDIDTRVIWLSLSEALFGRTSLMLPLPEMECGETRPLREDGVLESLPIVPGLYAIDIYQSLVRSLRGSGVDRVSVVPFAYDWRLDVMTHVKGLARLVEEVHRQGAKQTMLVAHSLGGLIASYYLRYGDQDPDVAEDTWEGAGKVNRVVMAGVPFQGSMTMFQNIVQGRTVGLNRSLLSPLAYASFPVTYYLLPALEQDVLLSAEGKPVPGLMRDPRMWRHMRWGLLKESDALRDDVRELRARYTASWLQRAERFTQLLHRPAGSHPERPVPLLYISGTDSPTLAKGVLLDDPAGGPNRVVFDARTADQTYPVMTPDVFVEDGDGTVTEKSGFLPSVYRANMSVTSRTYHESHADLVTSRRIQQEIRAFLLPKI